MRHRVDSRRQLSVESLEGRWLMAGDVLATLTDGNLLIEGDAAANAVAVLQDHSTGMIKVQGMTDVGTVVTPGTATTINGGASAEFSSVTSITVRLKGGDDTFLLTDVSLTGSVKVRTSDGNDNVVIGAMADVTPVGLDTTRLPAEVLATTFHQVTVGGNVLVDTGSGDDLVLQAGVTVAGSDIVSTGKGDDHVFCDVFTDVSAALPALGVEIGRASIVLTGHDDDTVNLNTVSGKHGLILTGRGDDQVAIQNSSFNTLAVILGRGDDSLNVSGTTTTKASIFRGGKGSDTINDLTVGATLWPTCTRKDLNRSSKYFAGQADVPKAPVGRSTASAGGFAFVWRAATSLALPSQHGHAKMERGAG